MKNIRVILFLLVCALAPMLSFGQKTGTLRGFVYDEANGEPAIFTTVFLKGTTFGTSSDINGFYSIPNIPEGQYTLMCTSIGYDTASITISIAAGKIITQPIYINESLVEIGAVEITADKADIEARTEVKVSTVSVTPKELTRIPTVGGEPDVVQYLQIIPGVIFTGDQGGRLYIRGGTPVQTKMLLDGVAIYNPFHSIGLFSVFETEIIKNVDVITGGFDAEYGGRVSAVVDIRTRDGDKKNFGGKFSASPFLAKAVVEGPISKLKDNGASTSFIFSGKHSYLNETSKYLYSYVDSNGIPYSFSDFYGKIAINTGNGSKLNFFGFNFNDRVNYLSIADYNWNSLGLGTNFIVVPGNANTLVSGYFSYSEYAISLLEGDDPQPRQSTIGGFNVGLDFSYFGTDSEVKYGFSVNGYQTTFEFFNDYNIRVAENQNTTELGFFLKYKKVFNEKFIFQPSVRTDYYASLNNLALEPRLGLKYNATRKLRFKIAGGVYSQNLISTRVDRDVVDLFTGFLSGPEEELVRPNGKIANHKLQRAYHAIFGVEVDPIKNVRLNVEPYYKYFSQIININRNKTSIEESDFSLETGDAYGIDFLVTYDYKKVYLWLAYSLGYVTRDDGAQTYPPHFDRRHNLNLVAAYTFGKDLNWEASARWNFGSGFPFTRTQGFYEALNFSGGVDTDYTTENGTLGITYEEDLNAGRLPSYHRLDLALKRKIAISTNVIVEVTASVTNAYDRENIFYFDRVRYERVNQLPILPSLSVSLSF